MIHLLHVYQIHRGRINWIVFYTRFVWDQGWGDHPVTRPLLFVYRAWHSRCSNHYLVESNASLVGVRIQALVPHKSYEVASHAGWLGLTVDLATGIRGYRRQGTQLSLEPGTVT